MLRCSSALRGDPPLCCVAALEACAGGGSAASSRTTTDLRQWLQSPQRSMRFATPSAAGGAGPCLQTLGAARGRAPEEAVASASGRLFQGPVGRPLTPASRLRQRQPADRLVASAQGEEGPSGPATDKEKEDWMRRQQESGGGGGGGVGEEWRWTLNWSPIVPGILVGSCPRSPEDIDRIADEGGVTALVNLQSDTCFEALQIPFDSIKQRAVERGVLLERIPIRDFDHGDQSLMLPLAVRMVNLLLARGHVVYIHCTAGINRASLTALGYLTFIKGMEADAALDMMRKVRPIVNPYMDCWNTVKQRLLSGRHEEQVAVAVEVYQHRRDKGGPGDSASDWKQAQALVISRVFQQYLIIDKEKLEASEQLWRWQQRGRSEEQARQREEAAEVARAQLQQLEEIGRTLEEKLNELSMRALTQQLHSLLASSKALRLQGQLEGPLPPMALASTNGPTNGSTKGNANGSTNGNTNGVTNGSTTGNANGSTHSNAATAAASAPSSPPPATGALAGAPAAADVTTGSAAPSQS